MYLCHATVNKNGKTQLLASGAIGTAWRQGGPEARSRACAGRWPWRSPVAAKQYEQPEAGRPVTFRPQRLEVVAMSATLRLRHDSLLRRQDSAGAIASAPIDLM
jgi:hypothetical protein